MSISPLNRPANWPQPARLTECDENGSRPCPAGSGGRHAMPAAWAAVIWGARAVACLPAGLLRRLPDDIGGVFIVPQALEPRVTEFPGGGPFAEAHLGDQAGLHPVHTGPRQVAAVKRGPVLLQAGPPGMPAGSSVLRVRGGPPAGTRRAVGRGGVAPR